ncbi:MAG: discoidin domain-containing protein [Verrucomicrobiota bacterium]
MILPLLPLNWKKPLASVWSRHWLLAVLCFGLLTTGQLQGQTTLGTEFPLGVGVQLKNEDTSAAALNKVDSMGVGVVRKAIYWETNEPTPGTYDWSQPDQWIADMEAKGFSMVITLVWNNRDYEPTYKRAITTQAGRDAFANYAADVAARYQGKDIIWEIWNEPNLNSFWYQDGNPSNLDQMADEYTALIKDTIPAMKAADPNCRVAVCSISALWNKSFQWFQRCLDQGLLTVDVDVISVHPYGFRWPELCYADGYPVIRQKLDAAGGTDVAIISSEVGYSEPWLIDRGYTTANVLNAQAACFVRQNLVDAMSDVQLGIWYEFSDTQKWGVVNNDLSERPTFTAAQVMTTELAGYSFKERLDIGDPLDWVVLMENASGDKKLVVWTVPSQSMTVKLPVTHTASIPVGIPGDYVVTDMLGNTTTLTTASADLDVTLTGEPQYIPLQAAVSVYGNIAPLATLDASVLNRLEKLTDGNYTNSGRWYSGTNWPEWIELDFGDVYTIDQVFLDQQTNRINDWSLEAWDGSAWVSVITGNHDGQNDLTISFSPIATDKLKLNLLTGDNTVRVYEIEVYGEEFSQPPPGVYENVALGKTATASDPVNVQKLTDGNYTNSGRWYSNPDFPEWVEIDLGGAHTIDQIALIQQVARTNDWNAEVWDGSAWVQVASGNADGVHNVTATFTPVSTSKVRFNITSGDNYLKVYEIEIYGAPD